VILGKYLAIGSMTGDEVRTTIAAVDRAVYRTDRHASVNVVYHGRSRRREEKRTDLFVRSGKSEAEVTNKRFLTYLY